MLRYNDFCDKDLLKSTAIQELRKLGYKNVQKIRKSSQKADQVRHITCESKLFHNELHLLPRKIETNESGVSLEIPTFVAEACECIEKYVSTEGIFRKAGSSARQREIKALLEDGKALGSDHHVIDVANILKLFFRELPEPLIPFNCHDILVWCLQMKEKTIDCLLLTCLIFPPHHLDTLIYFMQFLQRIADHADTNKMDVNNLSIIMAPTLMPVEEKKAENMNGTRLKNHVKVVELFIKNSRMLGELPKGFEKKLPVPAQNLRCCVRSSRRDEGNKKKRRSVLSGLRRMVGKAPSPCKSTLTKTESSHSFGKKRKALGSSSSFNRKKKRDEFRSYLPKESNLQNPQDTLMPCKACGLCPSPQVCYNPNVSPEFVKNKSCECEVENKRLMTGYPSMDTIQNLEEDEIASKLRNRGSKVQLNPVRRWSSMTTTRESKIRAVSDKNSFPSRISELEKPNDANVNDACSGSNVDEKKLQSDPPSATQVISSGSSIMANLEEEYEKIKSKVSAIENQLMEEFGRLGATVEGTMCTAPPIANEDMEVLESVQTKYEKTLEESGRISDASTDHLAKRLSRELKIRRSAEHKIIRSPSARKIGSIRRRSRDSCKQQKLSFNMDDSSKGPMETIPTVQTLSQELLNVSNHSGNELYLHSSLKRGRPNTVRAGLKQPSPAPQVDLESCPTRIHLTYLNSHPFLAQGNPSQVVNEHKETPKTKSQSLMELPSNSTNVTESGSLPAAWESKLKQIQNFNFATPDILKLKTANHLTYSMSTPMTPSHLRRASSFQDAAESSATKYKLSNQGDIKKCISSVNVSHETTNEHAENMSSHSISTHWHSAASFLSDQNLSEQPVSGRESIAKLRAQNAGKVLANVKLFEHNGKNQSGRITNCGNSNPNIRENLLRKSVERSTNHQNAKDQVSPADAMKPRRNSHGDKPSPKPSFNDSESPHNRQKHFRRRGRLSAPGPGKQRYHNGSSPTGQKKLSPFQWFEQSKENLIKSPEILVDDLFKNHGTVKDLILDNMSHHCEKIHNSHISPLKENNRIIVVRKDSPYENFREENDNGGSHSRNPKVQTPYTPNSPMIKHPLTCEHSSLRPISQRSKKKIGRPSPMRAVHKVYPDGTPKKSPRRQSPRLLLRSRLMSNACM